MPYKAADAADRQTVVREAIREVDQSYVSVADLDGHVDMTRKQIGQVLVDLEEEGELELWSRPSATRYTYRVGDLRAD